MTSITSLFFLALVESDFFGHVAALKKLRNSFNPSGQSKSFQMDISRLDAFELDKNEVLVRLSICLFLLLIILASITATFSVSYGCCIRRKKTQKARIRKQYIAKEKLPRKFMQSLGEAETDVETVITSPHSLASTIN
jgi:hypothetical protein